MVEVFTDPCHRPHQMKARGFNRGRRDAGRDKGLFVALPFQVIDSAAYQSLSHPAKSLLVEIARQYVGYNNGSLLASRAYLKPRGYLSSDVITYATRELLSVGLIFRTVIGQRPNKAAWFAVTWQRLDKNDKYDAGVTSTFKQGQYSSFVSAKGAPKKKTPRPQAGARVSSVTPPDGVEINATRPCDGAITMVFAQSSTPPDGHHLEKPSPGHAVAQVHNN